MFYVLHSYVFRPAFHQFVEFVSREGVETCRLAFLSRYLSVIGDGIAGVISRRGRRQPPVLHKDASHGGMIGPDTPYLQHVDHVVHVEAVRSKTFGLHDVADNREHFGLGFTPVVMDDPSQRFG